MELRACLSRFFSHPEAELPEWAIALKRSGRSTLLDSLAAEIRSKGTRTCRVVHVAAAQRALPVSFMTPSVIDAQNRRKLEAIGQQVYRDPAFRASITERLAERTAHQTRLEDIRNIGRVLLGE